MNRNAKKIEVLKQNNAEANVLPGESIEQVLILLMEEKTFSEISITDITKRAGMFGVIYYHNYTLKEEILSGYPESVVSDFYRMLKDFDEITQTEGLWAALFEINEEAVKGYPRYFVSSVLPE